MQNRVFAKGKHRTSVSSVIFHGPLFQVSYYQLCHGANCVPDAVQAAAIDRSRGRAAPAPATPDHGPGTRRSEKQKTKKKTKTKQKTKNKTKKTLRVRNTSKTKTPSINLFGLQKI